MVVLIPFEYCIGCWAGCLVWHAENTNRPDIDEIIRPWMLLMDFAWAQHHVCSSSSSVLVALAKLDARAAGLFSL